MAELLRVGALVALASWMMSCTMAPAYTQPDLPVAETFPGASGVEGEIPTAELGWRDVFGDERLQALIELALENNRDLRVAALNVERFQALYRIQRAPLLPNLGATGAATYQELPAAIPSSAFVPKSQYSANLGVTAWELDFFGRIRSLSEAALQNYFATAEAQRSAHLGLVAQVAIAHFDERAFADQLQLARLTLETVERSFDLTNRAYELGTASELDLRTSESQVETARYNYAAFEQRYERAQNALIFLVGTQLPADLPAPKPLEEAAVLANLPAGIPSDLLQRRPDILAAEHKLLAANASIGAARAAFFPSITLTGAAGFSSPDLGELFKGDSFTWNFTPRIHLPIFQGGALRASLDVQEISKSIEIAQYERTIQAAFREVADALVNQRVIEERLQAQTARVAADQRRYELADLRYRAGIDRYINLLQAQRDLYDSQRVLIDAQLERLGNLAALYRALGGGWFENTEEQDTEDT